MTNHQGIFLFLAEIKDHLSFKRLNPVQRVLVDLLKVYLTCSGGVHVGVEQRGHKLDLGGSGGEVILENDLTFVQSSLPGCPLLAGNPVPGKNI